MSFVKPTSKSSADLIGKAGLEADGAAGGLSVVDEPVAALGINEDHGSITAVYSDNDNTGTLMRGGPRTTAEEYGNAPSANGVGGELLAEHPAGEAPSAPQKEYSRGARTLVAMQGGGVVTVYPTANQSPDAGQGGLPVNSPSNTGHGNTKQFLYYPQDRTTCLWHSFQGVSGQIVSITMKLEWGAVVNATVEADEGESGSSYAEFAVEYSLNGGAREYEGKQHPPRS
jgi:hypothetical protein